MKLYYYHHRQKHQHQQQRRQQQQQQQQQQTKYYPSNPFVTIYLILLSLLFKFHVIVILSTIIIVVNSSSIHSGREQQQQLQEQQQKQQHQHRKQQQQIIIRRRGISQRSSSVSSTTTRSISSSISSRTTSQFLSNVQTFTDYYSTMMNSATDKNNKTNIELKACLNETMNTIIQSSDNSTTSNNNNNNDSSNNNIYDQVMIKERLFYWQIALDTIGYCISNEALKSSIGSSTRNANNSLSNSRISTTTKTPTCSYDFYNELISKMYYDNYIHACRGNISSSNNTTIHSKEYAIYLFEYKKKCHAIGRVSSDYKYNFTIDLLVKNDPWCLLLSSSSLNNNNNNNNNSKYCTNNNNMLLNMVYNIMAQEEEVFISDNGSVMKCNITDIKFTTLSSPSENNKTNKSDNDYDDNNNYNDTLQQSIDEDEVEDDSTSTYAEGDDQYSNDNTSNNNNNLFDIKKLQKCNNSINSLYLNNYNTTNDIKNLQTVWNHFQEAVHIDQQKKVQNCLDRVYSYNTYDTSQGKEDLDTIMDCTFDYAIIHDAEMYWNELDCACKTMGGVLFYRDEVAQCYANNIITTATTTKSSSSSIIRNGENQHQQEERGNGVSTGTTTTSSIVTTFNKSFLGGYRKKPTCVLPIVCNAEIVTELFIRMANDNTQLNNCSALSEIRNMNVDIYYTSIQQQYQEDYKNNISSSSNNDNNTTCEGTLLNNNSNNKSHSNVDLMSSSPSSSSLSLLFHTKSALLGTVFTLVTEFFYFSC